MQVGIGALQGDQLFVRPAFDDTAFVHHQNTVRPANGAQAVGDDKTSATFH